LEPGRPGYGRNTQITQGTARSCPGDTKKEDQDMKKGNVLFTIIALLAILAVAIPAIVGCGGSGATGDILYEGSTSSETVVASWVSELVEGGYETMAAADTTEAITHTMGNTPSAVSVIADGGAASLTYTVGTASLTSTGFTITRSGTDTADRQVIWIAVK